MDENREIEQGKWRKLVWESLDDQNTRPMWEAQSEKHTVGNYAGKRTTVYGGLYLHGRYHLLMESLSGGMSLFAEVAPDNKWQSLVDYITGDTNTPKGDEEPIHQLPIERFRAMAVEDAKRNPRCNRNPWSSLGDAGKNADLYHAYNDAFEEQAAYKEAFSEKAAALALVNEMVPGLTPTQRGEMATAIARTARECGIDIPAAKT